MKSFRPVFGKRFAKPFESEYSVIRRCLAANPGIPLSALIENLRRLAPENGSIRSRFYTVQSLSERPYRAFNYSDNYQRQCPECAKLLYHTDIFTLPWLTRCPIHHCELISICPECGQLWPDIKALNRRECDCCGLPNLNQLGPAMKHRIKEMQYQPIAQLYAFIQNEGHRYSLNAYYYNLWCRQVNVESLLFPSAHLYCHSQYEINQWEDMHVKFTEVRCKSSSLTLCNGLPNSEMMDPRRHDNINDNESIQTELKSNFKIMNRILVWISQHTPPDHQIRIDSCRYLELKSIVDGPCICPYCMALSLWFFNMATKKYGFRSEDEINFYPFVRDSRINEFYQPCEPFVYDRNTIHYFTLDQAFCTWFYQRGLIISFLDILRFTFYLRDKATGELRDIRSQHTRTPLLSSYPNCEFSDQDFYTKVADGKFLFFYENDDPLQKFEPPNFDQLDIQCGNYHDYLEKSFISNVLFHYEIPIPEFSYQSFLDLDLAFKEYVITSRVNRWSKSIPVVDIMSWSRVMMLTRQLNR